MLDQWDALLEAGLDAQAAAAAPVGFAPNTHMQQQQQRRQLRQLVENTADDVLDSFRRGTPRGACAHSAAYGWSMASFDSEGVDLAAYLRKVAGHDMVDVLAEAARLLNS